MNEASNRLFQALGSILFASPSMTDPLGQRRLSPRVQEERLFEIITAYEKRFHDEMALEKATIEKERTEMAMLKASSEQLLASYLDRALTAERELASYKKA